jgi:hypothetical protein
MMTDIELEDKYERFFRSTDIDLLAEIAAGGSGGGLANYYTKTETNTITNALDARITTLENGGGGGGDLSNYYTKGETNGLLATKQATNTVLTQLIGLTPTNDDIIQRKANAWTTRSPAQLKQDLSLDNVNNTSDVNKPISSATQGALDALDARVDTLELGPDLSNYYTKTQVDTSLSGKQAADSDLTAIAAIAPTNNDIIQRIAGAWTNRTPTQLKTSLSLVPSDVGLGNVNNTSDANKPISTATQTALDLKAALTVTNALDTRISTLESASVSTLTYSGTVTPDANTAKSFKLTMTGDAALAIPTNGAEGNRLFIAVTASGADRTLTLNGSYRLTTGTSATIVIPNTKTQYIGLRYNGTNWTVIASTQEL